MGTRPNGLRIEQVRVPLGVVAIIYENRPNVTSDAAGLCLKSGNAAFLRGQFGRSGVQPGHRRRPSRGLRQSWATRGLARPGGGHELRVGPGVHAAAGTGRLPYPSRRAFACSGRAGKRHRALCHRRGRQLPSVRRRFGRPRDGSVLAGQRQDPAAERLQCDRVAGRAPGQSPRISCPLPQRH